MSKYIEAEITKAGFVYIFHSYVTMSLSSILKRTYTPTPEHTQIHTHTLRLARREESVDPHQGEWDYKPEPPS